MSRSTQGAIRGAGRLFAGAVVVMGAGTVVAAGAGPSGAAESQAPGTTFSYSAPGMYTVVVPPQATASITLDAVGGAGYPGDPGGSSWGGNPGSGGSGTSVHAVIPVEDPYGPAGTVRWNDTLQISVAAKGGGGQRGYGDRDGRSGGNGGGATYVFDVTQNLLLIVAGGGGGGGGGGLAPTYTGGDGGTNNNGTSGVSAFGQGAGVGGLADWICNPTGVNNGTPGESAPAYSDAGGGGGGGTGYCGGLGGGSGNHGAGAGGSGGGGGAGASFVAANSTAWDVSAGSNTGAGSFSITWTALPPQVFTSPASAYAYAGQWFQAPVTLADPANLPISSGLSGAPGGVGLVPSNTPLISTLEGLAPATPGNYTFYISTVMAAPTGTLVVYQTFTLYVFP